MALKPCDNCGKEVKQRYASRWRAEFWLCDECKLTEKEPPDVKELQKKYDNIMVTTTYAVEGKKIIKYIDVISAEIIEGLSLFKDFSSGIADIFGGSASGYEKALDKMKSVAFNKLKKKAYDLGANAIIGIDLDYGDLRGSMLMLVVNGTAVIVE